MNMAKYEITAELNLKNIIAESREVAQALNEFADTLEQIEKKYAKPQENDWNKIDDLEIFGSDDLEIFESQEDDWDKLKE